MSGIRISLTDRVKRVEADYGIKLKQNLINLAQWIASEPLGVMMGQGEWLRKEIETNFGTTQYIAFLKVYRFLRSKNYRKERYSKANAAKYHRNRRTTDHGRDYIRAYMRIWYENPDNKLSHSARNIVSIALRSLRQVRSKYSEYGQALQVMKTEAEAKHPKTAICCDHIIPVRILIAFGITSVLVISCIENIRFIPSVTNSKKGHSIPRAALAVARKMEAKYMIVGLVAYVEAELAKQEALG
jgi:hypothetical protein